MEEERIELNAKERERLKVLHEVERGHLRQVDAARRLRPSDRQARRLLERLGKVGDRGLVHGLRGRPSNRKIPADLEQRSLRRLPLPAYLGFGPTLAAEHLPSENQDSTPQSKPNTAHPQITLGGNHGSGHFYLAKNRTLLLCSYSLCYLLDILCGAGLPFLGQSGILWVCLAKARLLPSF